MGGRPVATVEGQTLVAAIGLGRTFHDGQMAIPALKNVTLEVTRGEFVAIFGPSGSGKSTMLHLLGGIDRPTYGRVMVDGTDLSSLSEDQLTAFRGARIGFVFQFFNLVR